MVKKLMILFTFTFVACANEPAEQQQAAASQQQAAAPISSTAAATSTTPGSSASPAQQIDIRVSGGEYQPASVTVQKGQPVRLNFTRDAKPTCGDTLVFPALNIKKEIPVNQVVSVDITPQESGQLEFTCGMNMMKGAVVVQ